MEWGLDPVTEYGFLHWAIPSCGEGCTATTGGDAQDVAMSQWACLRPSVAHNQDRNHDEATGRQLFVLKPTSPSLTCVSLYKDRGPQVLKPAPRSGSHQDQLFPSILLGSYIQVLWFYC